MSHTPVRRTDSPPYTQAVPVRRADSPPCAQAGSLPATGKGRWLATWLCLATLLLASCARPQLAATPAPVVLHLAGSTSMQPLLHDLSAAYSQRYPSVSFDFAAMGSTAGLEVLQRGGADLALVSRELLSDEEIDTSSGKTLLAHTAIAGDAIAVIVNERNPLRTLGLHELRKIFAGQASHWVELGGPDMEITVVSREDGSATRDVFEALTMNGRGVTSMALIMPGSQAVAEYVAAHEGAIGYVSIGYVGAGVAALALEGVQPGRETIESGTYAITRPFLLVSVPDPAPEVTAFVQFVRSPAGQAIVGRTYGRSQ